MGKLLNAELLTKITCRKTNAFRCTQVSLISLKGAQRLNAQHDPLEKSAETKMNSKCFLQINVQSMLCPKHTQTGQFQTPADKHLSLSCIALCHQPCPKVSHVHRAHRTRAFSSLSSLFSTQDSHTIQGDT